MRSRFWIETTLSGSSAALFLLTLVWRDWIEALTGFDPDHGNGSLEFVMAAALLALALISARLARREYRQRLTDSPQIG